MPLWGQACVTKSPVAAKCEKALSQPHAQYLSALIAICMHVHLKSLGKDTKLLLKIAELEEIQSMCITCVVYLSMNTKNWCVHCVVTQMKHLKRLR